MTFKKIRLKISSYGQYESACTLYVLLDDLGLKQAWHARSAIMRRHGSYWDLCDHCGEVMGEHDEACLDKDGNLNRRYNEDWDMER